MKIKGARRKQREANERRRGWKEREWGEKKERVIDRSGERRI